jgi:hypothetical protein
MLPKVDELGLRILYLLIPGIIAIGIIKAIGPRRPRSDFETGLQIFIYGIVSYALVGMFEGLELWIRSISNEIGLWRTVADSSVDLAVLNPQSTLNPTQIIFATLASVIVGCAVAKIQTHSLPHQLLRKLQLTRRSNEVDIWEFTLNSPDIDSWITVRHHENGKVYQGWVRAYSDGGDERELLLADVRVYAQSSGDSSNDELVEVDKIPVLYLGLDKKNAILEMRIRTHPHRVRKDRRRWLKIQLRDNA